MYNVKRIFQGHDVNTSDIVPLCDVSYQITTLTLADLDKLISNFSLYIHMGRQAQINTMLFNQFEYFELFADSISENVCQFFFN